MKDVVHSNVSKMNKMRAGVRINLDRLNHVCILKEGLILAKSTFRMDLESC